MDGFPASMTCHKFKTMREFIIKYFGRIMALLGCTTMVTACYGIPVDPETHWVEGLVKDAETGKPIKGIKMGMSTTAPVTVMASMVWEAT